MRNQGRTAFVELTDGSDAAPLVERVQGIPGLTAQVHLLRMPPTDVLAMFSNERIVPPVSGANPTCLESWPLNIP